MDIASLRDFFMWCSIINGGLYLKCLVVYSIPPCRGWCQRVTARLFGLHPDTVAPILFGLMVLYEILIWVFVLVPWIVLIIMS